MRIGFASIYSWRPHVEHLHYLAELVRLCGHEVEFLTCDGDLPSCYTRELRNIRANWLECLSCRAGSIRSFESVNIHSIGELSSYSVAMPEDLQNWSLSSASSIGRFESEADFASPAFNLLATRLHQSVEKAYIAASNWISQKKLDAVVVFNGRIDATRGIFEAARNKNISIASLERTWFGDGLQILPGETCLGLDSIDRMVSDWVDKPLTHVQALKAASYISSRFLRRNQNEWRAYNVNAEVKPWPVQGRRKILLIPGSLNELWGHPQWGSSWKHPIDAYDALIDHFDLDPTDLVLRSHPNWGEKIGKFDGHMVEEHYAQWARQRGVLVIRSTESISTLSLIEQADTIVVASSSAALEASALGKQVIGIAGANYQMAGIREAACSQDELKALKLRGDLNDLAQARLAAIVQRNALRFAYTITNRIPQYVDHVKCITPTHYVYKKGAEGNRLIEMLKSGLLLPDDAEYAECDHYESAILKLMSQKRWMELIGNQNILGPYEPIRRRFPFVGLDRIRSFMSHGDR
jgi:hypothetical protein